MIVVILGENVPESFRLGAAFVVPLLPHLVFVMGAIWRLRQNEISLRELMLGPRRPVQAVSQGIFFGLGLVGVQVLIGILIFAIAAWVERTFGFDLMGQARQEQLGTLESLEDMGSPFFIAFYVLLVTVVAPISEELFFRGYVYTTFRSRWGVRMAVVASAFIFAVIHPYVALFLTVFVMGILFAIFFERSRSLLSMMVAHSVVNITVTVMAFQALANAELLA